MITKYYSDFNIKSSLISNQWKKLIENNDHLWKKYYGFDAILLPSLYWLQEPMLKQLHEKFPLSKCGILRVPAYENYDWHKDYDRGVCINMRLSFDGTSYCMFSDEKNIENNTAQHCKFEVLDYQPNTFYIFNNQQPHTLFNFEKPRYILSSEFESDKHTLSYEMVCNWAKENNYIS